jgi:hypothetical protein
VISAAIALADWTLHQFVHDLGVRPSRFHQITDQRIRELTALPLRRASFQPLDEPIGEIAAVCPATELLGRHHVREHAIEFAERDYVARPRLRDGDQLRLGRTPGGEFISSGPIVAAGDPPYMAEVDAAGVAAGEGSQPSGHRFDHRRRFRPVEQVCRLIP